MEKIYTLGKKVVIHARHHTNKLPQDDPIISNRESFDALLTPDEKKKIQWQDTEAYELNERGNAQNIALSISPWLRWLVVFNRWLGCIMIQTPKQPRFEVLKDKGILHILNEWQKIVKGALRPECVARTALSVNAHANARDEWCEWYDSLPVGKSSFSFSQRYIAMRLYRIR